jgi:protein farnesyltransferase subunit beta
LVTPTSQEQDKTVDDCLGWLRGETDKLKPADFNSHGIPGLRRAKHIKFLHGGLKKLPSGFVALDASRPWLVYWSLNSLSLLGFDLDTEYILEYKSRWAHSTQDLGFGG